MIVVDSRNRSGSKRMIETLSRRMRHVHLVGSANDVEQTRLKDSSEVGVRAGEAAGERFAVPRELTVGRLRSASPMCQRP
ncbi:hypothetical protein [Streptomyces sp. NPDC098781]|uniref:hypothetical protein n=1 Tax=Streptomyces sp. NPDC098781 TaxID=3366097 RepID=UPI0037F1458D